MNRTFTNGKYFKSISLPMLWPLAVGLALSIAGPAKAAIFKVDSLAADFEWILHDDSVDDSISANDVGGTQYEIYSTALQINNNWLVMGIRSEASLSGVPEDLARDKLVRFSDVVLKCIEIISNSFSEYAIAFDPDNQNGVDSVGLYADPVLTDVAVDNGNLLGGFGDYVEYVTADGGTPTTGTLDDSGFDRATHVPSILSSGNLIGDVQLLTDTEIEELNLEAVFAGKPGVTTAFATDITALQATGKQCSYYVTFECNNDFAGGTFLVEKPQPVPEPSSMLAFAMFGTLIRRFRY
ncbi:MAG: hypothetical protein AAF821_22870 [Cyanobacteria bacterium P01_D01_bin.156]